VTVPFEEESETDDSLPLRELKRLRGGSCQDCEKAYRDAEVLFSVALGFKHAPRCLGCLAKRLSREPVELEQQLQHYIQKRDCYLKAWKTISETVTMDSETISENAVDLGSATPLADYTWDAGDLGCGELVMELRIRLKNSPAGSVYEVIARDPAAPEDIPAWCRMCGYSLLKLEHPHYWILNSRV